MEFKHKKKYGQNFLNNKDEILNKIIEVSNINENDEILEIGPGQGALTSLLVERVRKVTCVEIDKDLENTLRKKFSSKENYTLVMGDVLEVDLKKYIIEKNGIDIIISDAELNKMDSYFIVENQDAQSQIDSIVNILYLFEDYDYVIFDTEGTVNNLTKAVLKATDYIFAPSKSSAIDINGLADLLNMYDISRVINPKLEIRKIFLVQTKQNTIVYKETKDELMKYFSNNEFSEISVREDQNILNSMKQQKDIFSYRSYSNAAIDYKNLIDEFLEEEEESEY